MRQNIKLVGQPLASCSHGCEALLITYIRLTQMRDQQNIPLVNLLKILRGNRLNENILVCITSARLPRSLAMPERLRTTVVQFRSSSRR